MKQITVTLVITTAINLLALTSSSGQASDNISPQKVNPGRVHSEIQRFFYKNQYGTSIEVDWLDQGGTSDDIRFVRSKFKANPNTSGIDIFWGGEQRLLSSLHPITYCKPINYPLTLKRKSLRVLLVSRSMTGDKIGLARQFLHSEFFTTRKS